MVIQIIPTIKLVRYIIAFIAFRILKDHCEASDVTETVMKNLRDKLEETENSLQKEKLDNQNIRVRKICFYFYFLFPYTS